MKMNESKCWDCKNCLDGCQWAKEKKPIEGWKVKERKYKDGTVSWCVLDCPEFQADFQKVKLDDLNREYDLKLGDLNDQEKKDIIKLVTGKELLIYKSDGVNKEYYIKHQRGNGNVVEFTNR